MANVLERALRVGEGRLLRRLKNYAEAVNHLEEDFRELTDDELKNETVELRERFSAGESLDDLKAHLASLYGDLTSGEIPCVRRRGELEVA